MKVVIICADKLSNIVMFQEMYLNLAISWKVFPYNSDGILFGGGGGGFFLSCCCLLYSKMEFYIRENL